MIKRIYENHKREDSHEGLPPEQELSVLGKHPCYNRPEHKAAAAGKAKEDL